MREIKFRAWDGKRLFEIRKLAMFKNWKGNKTGQKYSVTEGYYTCNPIAIMQFTGLRDKNGKEIYEGDIICWIAVGKEGGNTEDIGVERKMGNREVIFEDGKYVTTKPSIPIGHFEKQEIEVIGNKFEHPELLK